MDRVETSLPRRSIARGTAGRVRGERSRPGESGGTTRARRGRTYRRQGAIHRPPAARSTQTPTTSDDACTAEALRCCTNAGWRSTESSGRRNKSWTSQQVCPGAREVAPAKGSLLAAVSISLFRTKTCTGGAAGDLGSVSWRSTLASGCS